MALLGGPEGSLHGARSVAGRKGTGGPNRGLKQGAILSARERILPTMDCADESAAHAPFVFQIFTDFRGKYRWLLVDASGQRVRQSRFGFAVLAAAWRDAEAAKQGTYASARIVAPPLAR